MSRGNAGYIRPGYDPLEVPNAPTVGTATAGDASVSVTFTAPGDVGGAAITSYGVRTVKTSDSTTISGTGASSPVTVSGLTNGDAYTAAVWALNVYGPSPYSAASGSFTPSAPTGLFGAGGSSNNVIESVVITTLGNSTDFGDLSVARTQIASFSSSSRGLFAGGEAVSASNVIDYVTIASAGNATDFGDLLNSIYRTPAGCSSSTRGVVCGGFTGSAYVNVIQYVTMATTGNAIDFGDIAVGTANLAGFSSPTRGVFGGGFDNIASNYTTNVINYITIASAGNATDFGDLNNRSQRLGGCSSSTRGIFSGGDIFGVGYTNVIDYVTIATTGNATDFGDLLSASAYLSSCSSSTRGLIAGGTTGNVIQYVTIASTGNTTDFGDLLDPAAPSAMQAACSNAHGGLQ